MSKLPMPFGNPATYAGHSGVDFAQREGTPIPASGDGVVYHRNWKINGGFQIWVRYDLNGKEVGYAHMPSHAQCPPVGTRVRAGTKIGVVGNTGRSTGPHLHIEINGDATTAGVWRAFTRDAVVGGSVAGGITSGGWNQTSRPTKDIQRLIGAEPDGIHGPDTDRKIKAWQKANRLTADGIWGVLSDAVGFPITEDGDPGVRTIAKLQHAVGANIDGVDGPDTNRHLQEQLGVVVDGIRGAGTIRALQAVVGAKVDGEEGPDTWRKTQRHLNAGRSFRPAAPPSTPEGSVLDPAAPWKDQPVDYKDAKWVGSPNFNNGQAPARRKDHIDLHWFGSPSTLAGTDAHFQQPGTIKNGRGTGASSQYGIGADGTVHQYVREVDYAHTNGDTDANATGITIEHEGGPGKPITDATYEASIRLVADIARRIGIKQLVWERNIFPHRHYVATECPGTLDHERIIAGANALLAPEDVPGETVTVPRAELEALRDVVDGWLS
ncbi:peptidoglycan DD-metalloendopeptidase family protein [Microbacterium esteraromaticum]|uniref:N-acetylmuramoyl-L-alanine amidase n=1 Tax=Microbacterium esteraromaticum TaxID=57043 RepID=UPI0023688B33|nr:N-acetylmuramoyl-L-alanine amidase [Microbacterium esteraromaticum]WDH80212.1 peptidoglycan DD-metalloendopeptidase family protein [Microbacterium esteraromaticum]